jgi:prepilin-type N-terminal cleavage/methylation domain-containing protein
MKKLRAKKGFSLMELVLALAIFGLGSIVAGNLMIDANVATRIDLDKSDATLIAREGIEAVTSIRDADFDCLVVSSGTHGLSNPTGFNWVLNSTSGTSDTTNGKFVRTTTIVTIPTSGLMPITAVATSTVTVTWTDARSVSQSITLSTVLTNWRITGTSTDGVRPALICP